MLDTPILNALHTSVLCWLATCDEKGQPNVSPKEVFAAVDAQHLAIAHIASPRSVRNLADNPRVCVTFIDVFTQKGFKVLGDATVVRPNDPGFAPLEALLLPKAQGKFPIHAAILVRATAVEAILAPSYRFFPNATTEASQIASAMRAYGVTPDPNPDQRAAP